MKVRHSKAASRAFAEAPVEVQRAFLKQVAFLKDNLHDPSLHAKKYDESQDLWQARVNRDWRSAARLNRLLQQLTKLHSSRTRSCRQRRSTI